MATKTSTAATTADVREIRAVDGRRSTAAAAFESLRPLQWTKNTLLFAGVIFAAELSDAQRVLEAVVAFIAYCAASSAAYLVNDVRDAAQDRLHPVKRFRPIARGDLQPRAALALAAVVGAVALILAAALGPWSVLLLLLFVALQAAYTLELKYVVLLDVFAIAGLFVVRAAAGAVAVDVEISPWLLICTALLALFLALAKRRAEVNLVDAAQTPGRSVLDRISAAPRRSARVRRGSVDHHCVLALHVTAHDSQAMMLTIPFVIYGVFRYLLLIERDRSEEPERVLVTDRPLVLTIVLWAVSAAITLARPGSLAHRRRGSGRAGVCKHQPVRRSRWCRRRLGRIRVCVAAGCARACERELRATLRASTILPFALGGIPHSGQRARDRLDV